MADMFRLLKLCTSYVRALVITADYQGGLDI